MFALAPLEDLIVMKLFASRPLVIHDAEAVAVRQKRLDWSYIEECRHSYSGLGYIRCRKSLGRAQRMVEQ